MDSPSSPDKKRFLDPRAEEARLKALYRDLILKGNRLTLPVEAAKALVGPDCAYHLYRFGSRKKQKN